MSTPPAVVAALDEDRSGGDGFVFARPRWARGTVTHEDARFLHDVIVDAGATTGVEIGVASGCSSVVLLRALHQVAAPRGLAPRLHAFDIRDRCYFAPEYPTGAWVGEHVPELLHCYDFVLGDALVARRRLAPDSIPFAFIDGDHLHPSAVLDLMALLPVLTPSAWVVFHDVRLGAHGTGSVRGFGPARIVEAWPFERRIGGHRNITVALQLPGDKAAVTALWPTMLGQPWETCPPPEMLAALGVPAQPVTTTSEAMRLIDTALKKDRRLVIWGTGQGARQFVARLRDMGVEPLALVDRSSTATQVDGLPVMRPWQVRGAECSTPLVVVTGSYRAEIAAQLQADGWTLRTHFVVV